MTAATLSYAARLCPVGDTPSERLPTSWFVTFGFGKPAESTYTEVMFPRVITDEHPEHVLDAVVRRVAVDLYGTAWAFHYRPDQYDEAIGRYPVRLRERVVVTSVEVYQ